MSLSTRCFFREGSSGPGETSCFRDNACSRRAADRVPTESAIEQRPTISVPRWLTRTWGACIRLDFRGRFASIPFATAVAMGERPDGSSFVQICTRTGFHPGAWETARGILLRKFRKPTYSVAKAHRTISLLSWLGKIVERAVATWIASFCETNEVFHRGKFGCRRGERDIKRVGPAGRKTRECMESKHCTCTTFRCPKCI